MRFLLLFVFLLGIWSPLVSAQPNDAKAREELERDVRAFATSSIQDNPWNFDFLLGTYVVGTRFGFFGSNEWIEALKEWRGGRTIVVENVSVESSQGDEATVEITFHDVLRYSVATVDPPVETVKEVRGQSATEMLRLRLEEVRNPHNRELKVFWRVIPPTADAARRGLESGEIKRDSLLYKALLVRREPELLDEARLGRALSRGNFLGLGASQFAQDYNGVFFFDDAGKKRALRPYLKDESLFLVAGTDQVWRFNELLSNRSAWNLAESTRTVMFYDGDEGGNLNFRWNNRALVVFADGHVEALTRDAAKNLIWKP